MGVLSVRIRALMRWARIRLGILWGIRMIVGMFTFLFPEAFLCLCLILGLGTVLINVVFSTSEFTKGQEERMFHQYLTYRRQ